MPVCGIPLKRWMPSSLSQARTRYPPAGCADLVNEFISWVVAAALGPGALRLTAHVAPQSESQLQHRGEERKERKNGNSSTNRSWLGSHHLPPGNLEGVIWWLRESGNPCTRNSKDQLGRFPLCREACLFM